MNFKTQDDRDPNGNAVVAFTFDALPNDRFVLLSKHYGSGKEMIEAATALAKAAIARK
jgi:hypothetical protein